MKYANIVKGCFRSRPNRFVAKVTIHGEEHTVHVKNTGRCRELLTEGAQVYLTKSANPLRKTQFDLVAVEKKREGLPPLMVNMDSQIPNDVVAEWLPQSGLFSSSLTIKREVFYGESRFDLFVCDGERKAFIEVKGVTLEKDGVAMFPDAPTLRGAKHLKELVHCLEEGYEAYAVFLVQMKGIRGFCPNTPMDPAFSDALMQAYKKGVKILCLDCKVDPDTIVADSFVELLF